MNSLIYNIIGTGGVICILAMYLMLQTGRITAESYVYSAVNLLGSGAILFSLIFEFNLASFFIEVFWVIISMYGLIRTYRQRRDVPRPAIGGK